MNRTRLTPLPLLASAALAAGVSPGIGAQTMADGERHRTREPAKAWTGSGPRAGRSGSAGGDERRRTSFG